MSDWRERVKIERDELNEKTQKLSDFINHQEKFGAISKKQQTLLQRQETAMFSYLRILDQRLRLQDE